MAKSKSIYVCNHCGHQVSAWMGKCPSCNEWNSIQEELKKSERAKDRSLSLSPGKTFSIIGDDANVEDRFNTGSNELDKLLGGGMIKGASMLLGGEPGIGKSTLLLQIASNIGNQNRKVLYVSGEESLRQLRLRAKRLSSLSENIEVLCETSLEIIKKVIAEKKPDLVIVDSIQMIFKEELSSAPGTVSQIRECSSELVFLGKANDVAIFFIGHLTKSGEIAGPRVLEHLVDTVLYFEGERLNTFRIIRAFKNRYGSTNELAVFEMKENGLIDVDNPSQIFLSEDREPKCGAIVVPCVEGSRPILVELQALTIEATFGSPLRKASGLDANRLAVILAIIEKHLDMPLRGEDIFINAAGGLKIKEPALDVGMAIAIISSYLKKEIASDVAAFGEIGLNGELRPTSQYEKRISELEKMGFRKVIVPPLKEVPKTKIIKIEVAANISDLLEKVFE
ncbi:MAG: DNA repair protein RadA [Planctomycetota bacterium]|nr:MAG: DNA repair protein RadA [Planctomycetota bacterium]